MTISLSKILTIIVSLNLTRTGNAQNPCATPLSSPNQPPTLFLIRIVILIWTISMPWMMSNSMLPTMFLPIPHAWTIIGNFHNPFVKMPQSFLFTQGLDDLRSLLYRDIHNGIHLPVQKLNEA